VFFLFLAFYVFCPCVCRCPYALPLLFLTITRSQ
jgi:hypothetical protein